MVDRNRANARVHGLEVATRNERDFREFQVTPSIKAIRDLIPVARCEGKMPLRQMAGRRRYDGATGNSQKQISSSWVPD
jgi:hypothetical protein